eukprot:CAMPEP_0173144846 /NCGR_PEP_ID=MMETSP1105-20130129/7457_1 /TAXON_ID=2985 /ORGANISM="Ochromonas sp., Strain BG-1" /LENGTH=501 /DNA_ID=CAMNT_0014058567 /DNA_START=183 /DNA_END=1689 /DNA_ORIENTATION=-
MTHGCEFSQTVDMDDLYSYGNHHYHHTPPLPYDAHTMYFQLSAHFQRVDAQLNHPLSLYLKISLGSFFVESIVLTEQQLAHSFAFTFPVIIPEVLTEERHAIQNNEIDDVILLQISELSIHYLPPVKKYPLYKRSSAEIIATLSNHSLSDDHVIDNETLKKCDQLGLPHANVLNQIDISPNLSTFLHERMTSEQTLPQIFCGIFTTERQHEDNVRAIKDTWSKKCTSFLAFSTTDDDSIPSINLPHLGSEKYSHMWQKTRAIWKYVASYYSEDYDWFLLGGDDMYYVMENLFVYLTSPVIVDFAKKAGGLYLGRPFFNQQLGEFWYNTGGPGYILDKRALKQLVSLIDSAQCKFNELVSMEDIYVANCLRYASPSIYPIDTRDELQRHRFHYFPPGYLFDPGLPSVTSSVLPSETVEEEQQVISDSDRFAAYGHNCCSSNSISFHYINGELMRSFDDYLFACPWKMKELYYNTLHGGNWSYYEPDQQLKMIVNDEKAARYQ